MSQLAADPALIEQALNALYPAGVIELRGIYTKGRKRVDAGYFDTEHRKDLVREACRMNQRGASVYVTLNALDPQLLARCSNRVQEYAQATATDANIVRRQWLLIDVDPQRPKDTSATDEQLQLAEIKATAVREFLTARGWPEAALALSGNGVHLLYRIDLPNTDATRDLLKSCLEALALRFNDEHVKVDRSVFNAARIVKLHGTIANKGDNVPIAPWRCSRLTQVPQQLDIVSQAILEDLARLAAPPPTYKPNGQHRPYLVAHRWAETDVAKFLSRANLEGVGPDNHGGVQRWKLRHCPFNPEHGFGEAAVFLAEDGRLGFECRHDSCQDKHWKDLRELVDGKRGANGAARSHSTVEDMPPAPDLTEEELERWAIQQESALESHAGNEQKPDQTVEPDKARSPGIILLWKDFIGRDPPARQWIIPHWIPAQHVTLLSGRGGVGKSLLAQHLGSALSTGAPYLEPLSAHKVLMWAAEDDADELWRRQVNISFHLESPFQTLTNFTLRSCVGCDVTLAAPLFNGLTPTPLLHTLREEVCDLKVDFVILDNIARIYGGNENDRHQVTTFVAWLQSACAPAGVLLLGHPAKAAGSEFSGSTAWEGAVRARLYFSDRPPDEPVEEDAAVDPDVRYLSRRKANYSDLDLRKFNLREGVLIPEEVQRRSGTSHVSGQFCKDVVLRAVRKLSERGLHGTSSTSSPTYLPKLAKQYSLLESATEKSFGTAMRKMVIDGDLVTAQVGVYSNRTPKMGLVIPAQVERTNG